MNEGKRTRFRRLILTHLSQVKGGLLVAALFTLSLALADLLRPWPLKIIFDYILLNKPLPHRLAFLGSVFADRKTLSVVMVSLSIILITAVKSLSAYSQTYITSRIGFKLAHSLRRELFIHLQRLSISFHKQNQTGELLTKITSDTNNLRDVFSEFVLTFISELLTLLGMVVIMVSLNWRLSLILVGTFPPLIFLALYRYRTIRDSARRQRKAEGQIASRVSEILSSILVVQAFGRESYEEERFDTQSVLTLNESIRTARLEAAAARGVDIIVAIGTWGVILFGSLQALKGQMTPGNVLVFASYMTSIYGPIRNLTKLSSRFSRAMVSAGRIADILDTEPDVQDDPDAIDAGHLKGEIHFQNIFFDYGDGRDVLKNIALRVSSGQHVALLGRSGSGKSTLSGLILRFYDPQQGSITIDGVNLKKYRRDTLRREIGVVLQDSILFGATVRENIAYGKLDATMDEIVAAARAANAHDFILQLENGYDTIISERAGNLSGGQRQRIAIARTFIRNVPILILDEPMTGLDVESETAVRDALRRLMNGRTCLLITHDLQMASESDQIVVLDEGQIVEQGTHDELLTGSQRYRELWELKSGQYEDRELRVEARQPNEAAARFVVRSL
jgi:ABC-type multidrug transport system fused ATPase/permease subunit